MTDEQDHQIDHLGPLRASMALIAEEQSQKTNSDNAGVEGLKVDLDRILPNGDYEVPVTLKIHGYENVVGVGVINVEDESTDATVTLDNKILELLGIKLTIVTTRSSLEGSRVHMTLEKYPGR